MIFSNWAKVIRVLSNIECSYDEASIENPGNAASQWKDNDFEDFNTSQEASVPRNPIGNMH